MDNSLKEWFVVQTHLDSEDLAVNGIKKLGFEVYCPKYLKITSHARKKQKILKPLFSRYIFVSFKRNNINWRKINFTRGVSSIISANNYLTALPNFFLKNIRKYETKDEIIDFYKYIVSIKEKKEFSFLFSNKKIIKGISTGVEKANQVRLLINLLGREIYCWVSKDKIEAV